MLQLISPQSIIASTARSFTVSLKDSQISTYTNAEIEAGNVQYLIEFYNDISKGVYYAYTDTVNAYNRYTRLRIRLVTDPADYDRYAGNVYLSPNGYWKYTIYEVTWITVPEVGITSLNAPATPTMVLPVENTNGVVEGIVEIGKMYLSQNILNDQEVEYTEYKNSVVERLVIADGGAGYTSAPTITITAPTSGTTATATATITGGIVTALTITDGGTGYTSAPTVTASGGGGSTQATIVAYLTESNYIYVN